jgi:hypothetical protein
MLIPPVTASGRTFDIIPKINYYGGRRVTSESLEHGNVSALDVAIAMPCKEGSDPSQPKR